ncbi:MAG: nucleotidyltransferase domain-containing protein [Chloroflexi bacterium]|nr:MAG: nucleotidyltransferase domain-containing protein [Chloroflexota bacterium]
MDKNAPERKRLLEQELKRYLELLQQYVQPEKVIIFGSLATGKIQAWSDIDLLVIQSTNLPFMERLHQIRQLLKPQVATDILVYTPDEFEELCRERPFVRDEIAGKGIVVYERAG